MKIRIKDLTESAVFAALIFVATLSGSMAPIGNGAYIHIGDALIYTAVLFLSAPFAICAAAIGAGFADIMLGSAVYVIPTVIVKTLTVLFAKFLMGRSKKPLMQDTLISLSGIVTVVGYFVAEYVMYAAESLFHPDEMIESIKKSALATAASGIMFNVLQALMSAVVFIIISAPARKIYNRLSKKDD